MLIVGSRLPSLPTTHCINKPWGIQALDIEVTCHIRYLKPGWKRGGTKTKCLLHATADPALGKPADSQNLKHEDVSSHAPSHISHTCLSIRSLSIGGTESIRPICCFGIGTAILRMAALIERLSQTSLRKRGRLHWTHVYFVTEVRHLSSMSVWFIELSGSSGSAS